MAQPSDRRLITEEKANGTYAAYKDVGVGPLAPLRSALKAGQSVGMQVEGDSTGNEMTEWVYLFGQSVVEAFPAYTAMYWLWGDANQKYPTPSVIATGPGGERRISPSTQGAFVPGNQFAITSPDLDLRLKVSFNTWPLAANSVLACHGYTAGNYSFRFMALADGTINIRFSKDGTTNIFPAAVTPAGIAAGTPVWLRFTYKADNGASGCDVTFYQSTDGEIWTQISSVKTTAGTGSLFASTQDWEIGAEGFSGSPMSTGSIYAAYVLDGIAGNHKAPMLIDGWQLRSPATATRSGAPVLAIVNGSHPGASLTYLNDATRLPKMVLPMSQAVCILSCSHNDGTATSGTYLAGWDVWLARLRTALPGQTQIVVSTQNPEVPPSVYRAEHANRHWQIATWARKNNLPVVDAFAAFNADSRGLAALINADGLHPSPAGSALWRDTMLAAGGF